jgi:hypothetical protein
MCLTELLKFIEAVATPDLEVWFSRIVQCHTVYRTVPRRVPYSATPCTVQCQTVYHTVPNRVPYSATPCTVQCHTVYRTVPHCVPLHYT